MLERFRRTDKLTLCLYGAGLLFLLMAAYSWAERNSVPDYQKPVLSASDALDLEQLTASAGFSQFGEVDGQEEG